MSGEAANYATKRSAFEPSGIPPALTSAKSFETFSVYGYSDAPTFRLVCDCGYEWDEPKADLTNCFAMPCPGCRRWRAIPYRGGSIKYMVPALR